MSDELGTRFYQTPSQSERHLCSSFQSAPVQCDSLACILTPRFATQEVKQRLAHDAGAQFHNHHREMVTAIFKEVERVVATHKARAAEWYNEVGSPASTLHVLVVNPAHEPRLLKAWTLMAERRTVGERDEGGDAA